MAEMIDGTRPADQQEVTGLIAWFARNHVAANLLMFAVVATGLLVARGIRQEIYPTFTLDVVEIEMEYPGASPDRKSTRLNSSHSQQSRMPSSA